MRHILKLVFALLFAWPALAQETRPLGGKPLELLRANWAFYDFQAGQSVTDARTSCDAPLADPRWLDTFANKQAIEGVPEWRNVMGHLSVFAHGNFLVLARDEGSTYAGPTLDYALMRGTPDTVFIAATPLNRHDLTRGWITQRNAETLKTVPWQIASTGGVLDWEYMVIRLGEIDGDIHAVLYYPVTRDATEVPGKTRTYVRCGDTAAVFSAGQ